MPEICWTVHLGENWRICGKAISFDMSNCYRNWELYKIQHPMLDNPLKHTLEYKTILSKFKCLECTNLFVSILYLLANIK